MALLGLAFALSAYGNALNPQRSISQYAHNAWRIQDGFLPNAPEAFAQTADGYLWIGAYSGLVRFDRVRWDRDGFWAIGLAVGGSLLIGFLTPVSATLAVIGDLGLGFSLIPASTQPLFDSRLRVAYVTTTAIALIFLGPGAFSLDARLFGRREIIIPHHSRPQKS